MITSIYLFLKESRILRSLIWFYDLIYGTLSPILRRTSILTTLDGGEHTSFFFVMIKMPKRGDMFYKWLFLLPLWFHYFRSTTKLTTIPTANPQPHGQSCSMESLKKHTNLNLILIDRTHVPHCIKDLACAQFSLVLCT